MKNRPATTRSWLFGRGVENASKMARAASFLLLAVLALSQSVQAQNLVLQLQSTNYNPTTGLWTATVGPNAQASGTYPTLTSSASPNGAPAVVFTGNNVLALATSIPAGSGYTAVAYIKPATGTGPYALFGGASGAFEYRIYQSKQDALKQQTTDLGSETTALSTSAFSLIDCTVTNVAGGAFRLNGVADGNTAASSFTQPISAIGARSSSSPGEYFSGSVCEIDIYTGVLTPAQLTNAETALTAEYVTVTPKPPAVLFNTAASPSAATVGGNDTLSATFTGTAPLSYQWQISSSASGAGAVNIAGATNSTLVLSNLQLSASGYYYSLRATNTVSPYTANSAWLQLNVVPLTPLVQLLATNYIPGSGVWTDSSGNGNNATYSGSTTPTEVSFVTPNGGAAVNIPVGGGSFLLSSPLSASLGYTVFAYVEPSNASGRQALTGGSASTALEYDIYGDKQDYLTEYTSDVGSGTTAIPTNSFSLLDLAVNSSGATFRINGTNDSTVAGASFGASLTRIGNNHGSGDSYLGDIAEIDIFSGALTYLQITNVEAQLIARYVTANSIIIGAATVSPTNVTYAGNSVTLGAPIIGATASTTFRWQTDNGTGGAVFSNITGATTTNYVLNTTSLNGTYEYQLIGTPFGGSSVTSAPVTLVVQAASAPVLLTDTTINPVSPMVYGNATLSAAFGGNLPISYQWQISANASGRGAVNIAGATNASLTLSNLQLTNSGYYYSLQASNAVAPHLASSSWTQLIVAPLTPLVQLQATNYSLASETWNDSSGNGNNAFYAGSTAPTLVPFATPNGGSAVNISAGGGSFILDSSLDPSSGYTVFAYVEPSSTSGRNALTGGSTPGALEYDIYNGKQDYLIEYMADNGTGTSSIPTSSFSLLDLAVNSSGGSYRINGASDGTVIGATFTSPLTRIGNNEGSGDSFVGDIAEIDIYNGVLSSNQISVVEAQLTASYVTSSSIAIGPATVAPTNTVYAGNSVTLSAQVIGASGATSYYWQTDNGTGGAVFSNITGATSTNYVLNTTSLNGTYEYQLVGTPFGGSSVTSAPVSLVVMAASSPTLVSDVAAVPSVASVGGNDTLSASFTGNTPITYQWFVSANSSGSGAVAVPGATNASLTLYNLQLANSGTYYSLQASNAIAPHLGNSSWFQLTVVPLAPELQLLATNYSDVTGVWTDSSGNGNDATYSGPSTPPLVTSATPSGSPAVYIDGSDGSFVLASSLDPSIGYTVFAYLEPASTSGRNAITGGSSPGALEYDIHNGVQDYLTEYTADVGNGTAVIPTTSFSLLDLAVNSSGGSFRINGALDATVAGATFSSPITRIGNNEGSGDSLLAEIAEIDIYSGALSSNQISAVEAKLTAAYSAGAVSTSPTNITATLSGSVLSLSWPANHLGWRLLVQTNHLATGVSSNTNDWTTVPGSTSVDQTNITINPALPNEFYRLVYP